MISGAMLKKGLLEYVRRFQYPPRGRSRIPFKGSLVRKMIFLFQWDMLVPKTGRSTVLVQKKDSIGKCTR